MCGFGKKQLLQCIANVLLLDRPPTLLLLIPLQTQYCNFAVLLQVLFCGFVQIWFIWNSHLVVLLKFWSISVHDAPHSIHWSRSPHPIPNSTASCPLSPVVAAVWPSLRCYKTQLYIMPMTCLKHEINCTSRSRQHPEQNTQSFPSTLFTQFGLTDRLTPQTLHG